MSVSSENFKAAALFSAAAIVIVSSGCSGDPGKAGDCHLDNRSGAVFVRNR